jgi:DNA/RNA-binding domain of Phe-tRNA-synthetase-like protein
LDDPWTRILNPLTGQDDLQVVVSDAWRSTFPESRVGLLLLDNVVNGPAPLALQTQTHRIEAELRQRFGRADRATLAALPSIAPYQSHYKAFGQNYHVLRQVESIAIREQALSSSSALVLAMFAAEVHSQLLTAGHDVDALQPPLTLDVSEAGETFVGLGGKQHVLRAGDMLIRDTQAIISAVIYGPDERTRLTNDTRRALFSTYAPRGISSSQVLSHLEELAGLVGLFAPEAQVGVWLLDPAEA